VSESKDAGMQYSPLDSPKHVNVDMEVQISQPQKEFISVET
jgi:hypothetical protein